MDRTISPGWRIWIDTGGTFTDCVAVDPQGMVRREKVLSSAALRGSVRRVLDPRTIEIAASWEAPANFLNGFEFFVLGAKHSALVVESYDPARRAVGLSGPVPSRVGPGTRFEVRSREEAPVLAARLATGTPAGVDLPRMSMRLATTRGTNALLERRGGRAALFVTRGFGDLLRIGDQQRPDLFALHIRKPEPLYDAVVEVPGRVASDGTVHEPLWLDAMRDDILRLVGDGFRCAAVAFLNSYANPVHERAFAEHLLRAGFDYVSCSSTLAPFIKIVPRAETAVVNAYLSPTIDEYLDRVQAGVGSSRLHVMTSTGGLVRPPSYRAKDSLRSGPAGGVVGAALAGLRSGFAKVISFDMGGTSTDVARVDGDYEYVFEHVVGDAHLVAPALAVESVAAGGGSVCRFDSGELRVGPESAGAEPGPACYGAGGPLTLTDVNLLLGRLDPARFDIPIDVGAARRALDALAAAIEQKDKRIRDEDLLEGLRRIADERMADAIRRISIRSGYDPAEYVLVAFGGAGGQHACGVADRLGVETVVVPQDAGVLSAWGLGNAVIERFAETQILRRLDDVSADIPRWIRALSKEAVSAVRKEGVARPDIEVRRVIVTLRLAGQESSLQVGFDENTSLDDAFEAAYRETFGYSPEGRAIEVETIRVVASSVRQDAHSVHEKKSALAHSSPGTQRAWFGGRWRTVEVHERHGLMSETLVRGPALVFERHSVTAVDEGWTATVDAAGALVLRRRAAATPAGAASPEVVRIELFTHRFETIAREMGEMLRRTAVSTNVKERLDFSCAVLDAEGELVVNAPHIPVHLGAIGVCVRSVRDAIGFEAGDVIVTNHPKYGGSHLPDITVITPVHLDGGRLLGHVASRAHHAEIGGVRPGSMPPTASTLAEEGVVIPPTHLFKSGEARWDDVRRLLRDAPFPSRSVEENIADLRAAAAANRRGAAALLRLAADYGADTVRHYMSALKKRAADRMGETLGKIADGVYRATEHLDDGSPLCATIEIAGNRAHIDFSGSAGVHPGNLNMTPAVARSAVIYVLRLLVAEPLPLNEGLLHAVDLHIPPGILNPPFSKDPSRAPAVVGGNVETSQRLVDTLLKALGVAACSQGTMNNVLFGTDHYSYYETVCGGGGAGPDFDGASAVHTHMTNTRITDPEIIEHRYPVRVERFAIRPRSGGDGARRGGDGVVRELTFLEKMSLSVLGQHRTVAPYGLKGGAPGTPAVQRVRRKNGETVTLGPIDGCEVDAGDRFILETPGGGGYGEPK